MSDSRHIVSPNWADRESHAMHAGATARAVLRGIGREPIALPATPEPSAGLGRTRYHVLIRSLSDIQHDHYPKNAPLTQQLTPSARAGLYDKWALVWRDAHVHSVLWWWLWWGWQFFRVAP